MPLLLEFATEANMMLVIKVAGAIIVIGIAGLMAWIRLAPVDVRDWHAALK